MRESADKVSSIASDMICQESYPCEVGLVVIVEGIEIDSYSVASIRVD